MDARDEDEPEGLGPEPETQAGGVTHPCRQRVHEAALDEGGHHADQGEDGADRALAEAQAALPEQGEGGLEGTERHHEEHRDDGRDGDGPERVAQRHVTARRGGVARPGPGLANPGSAATAGGASWARVSGRRLTATTALAPAMAAATKNGRRAPPSAASPPMAGPTTNPTP